VNGGKAMRGFLTVVARCAGYGSALFLTAMMLITVADVTLRALFNLPITGAYDLVQLFLVGTIFLSIPHVFLRDENIVIDFVDHVFGRTLVGLLKVLGSLTGFVFIAVLSWKTFAPALDAMRFNEVSPDLAIPMTVHWSLMIAGIVLTLPVTALTLVETIRSFALARDAR
jgi:TRAP-type C4-dicarboxylate transport system permease small subunit